MDKTLRISQFFFIFSAVCHACPSIISGDSIVPNTIIEISTDSINLTLFGLTADFGPCPAAVDVSIPRRIQIVSYKSGGSNTSDLDFALAL